MFGNLPQKHYRAVLADPPWKFRPYSAVQVADHVPRNLERHYRVMTVDDICALPVRSLAAKTGCHLFLWVPGPNLPAAFKVMEAWGFRYSAIAFCWVKLRRSFDVKALRFVPMIDMDLHVGLGLTTRHNVELCLLGRRGNARRLAKDVREVILSPVRQHSRKPDETYDRIERYCSGPYLELFARQGRAGWDCFGDETDKYGRLPDERADETSTAEPRDLSGSEEDRPRGDQELQQQVPGAAE